LWPKTDLARLPAPKPIRLWHWMSIIALVFVSTLFCMLFIIPTTVSNNTLFIVILVGITLFVTGIFFSIRLFLYGLGEEKVKIWDEQIEYCDKQWQEWSMQSLAVLGSVLITPQNLSVDDLLNNQGEQGVAAHEMLTFSKHNKRFYLESYEWIFSNLYDCLNQIGDNYTLTVLLLSEPGQQSEKERLIRRAYNQLGFKLPLEFRYQSTLSAEQNEINQLIDEEDPALYLVIADNVKAADSSAFMSALLLANESLYTDMPYLQPQSHILRTMQTTPDQFPSAITQMHQIQSAFSHIRQLWYSQFDEKAITVLRSLFFKYGIVLNESDHPALYPVDTYFGYPNKALSYWLVLALTTQAVAKTQQTQLVVANVMDKLLFSVVSLSRKESIA